MSVVRFRGKKGLRYSFTVFHNSDQRPKSILKSVKQVGYRPLELLFLGSLKTFILIHTLTHILTLHRAKNYVLGRLKCSIGFVYLWCCTAAWMQRISTFSCCACQELRQSLRELFSYVFFFLRLFASVRLFQPLPAFSDKEYYGYFIFRGSACQKPKKNCSLQVPGVSIQLSPDG